MRPAVPPLFVAALMHKRGHLFQDQARNSGYCYRHFCRLVRSPWEKWPIGKAQQWCESMGLDLWNLRLPRGWSEPWDVAKDREALVALHGSTQGLAELVEALNGKMAP